MPTLELDESDIVEVTPISCLTLRRLERSLRDIGGAGSAWAIAHRCVGALCKELRAQAVLVHAPGRARDELRTIGAVGKRAGELLGASFWTKDDAFARAVIGSRTPLRLRFDAPSTAAVPARLAVLAPSRSAIAVSVRASGAFFGIVEVIDPDERFDALVPSAVALVAELFRRALAATAATAATAKDRGGRR
jgi:hypothetical protein